MPRRVSLDDLELSIYIAQKVAPKHLKSELKNGLTDETARRLARHIVEKMNITEAIGDDPAVHHSMG